MATYWNGPTGYQKGRPRIGEVREPTPGGIQQTGYRARHKNNAEWLHIRAMYQQFYKLANQDRVLEIARGSNRRRKFRLTGIAVKPCK